MRILNKQQKSLKISKTVVPEKKHSFRGLILFLLSAASPPRLETLSILHGNTHRSKLCFLHARRSFRSRLCGKCSIHISERSAFHSPYKATTNTTASSFPENKNQTTLLFLLPLLHFISPQQFPTKRAIINSRHWIFRHFCSTRNTQHASTPLATMARPRFQNHFITNPAFHQFLQGLFLIQ